MQHLWPAVGAAAFLLLTGAPLQAKELVVPVIIPPLHDTAKPKKVESVLNQAQAALTQGRYRDADRLYHTALELDHDAFLAQEGLANVARARGMTEDAIRLLKEALPIEPADRVGSISLTIGDLYAGLLKWDEAAAAYRDAVAQGAQFVVSNYALGLALYKLRRFREAEVYLRQAELSIGNAPEEFRTQKEQLLHLLLAEIYANLNFPRYAIAEAHAGIKGKNEEVRKTAWKVEDRFDNPIRRLNLTVRGLFDKNPLAPFNTVVPLNGQQTPDSPALLTAVDLNLQTSPSQRWAYGGQYSFAANTYTATNSTALSSMANAPQLWVSWWNLKNTEFKLFYDYSLTTLNSRVFLQTHGPQLTYRLFWNRRHELAVLYSLHRNYFQTDPPEAPVNSHNQQSGLEHLAIIRASFAGPTPAIQPYVQYSFDGNLADGSNFYALINSIEAGFSLWTYKTSRLTFGGAYSHVDFPNNLNRRADKFARFHAGLNLPLSSRLSAAFDVNFTSDHSNLNNQFAFHRTVIAGGLTYVLPF